MQKKIMAVAVAGALALPGVAAAQSSTVQIYGVIIQNMLLGYDRNGTSIKHDMQQTTDSEFGVRGEEKLGGDLSAWFQCASTFTLNDGSATNTLCGKNSGVGFRGSFGNAFVGMWDAPLKLAMAQARPFSTSGAYGVGSQLWSGAASNVANGVAGGNSTQQAASFTRRQKNMMYYMSPNWGGFEFKAAMSNANEATGQTSATTAAKPRLWGVAGSYTNGPLYLALGYERHQDFNPANGGTYRGGSDWAWDIGAAYTIAGVFKLSGIYHDAKYDTNLGGTNNMDVRAYGIYGDWAITGPHRLRLGYTVNRDTKGTVGLPVAGAAATPAQITAAAVAVGNYTANGGLGGTGSKLYDIQYSYNFSKRTEVSFGYAKVDNEDYAAHALQSAGGGILGQNQDAFILGIRHSF